MREAIDSDDFETVSILGHNLRGSGGGFGFQAITDLGAELEQAAGDTDVARARKLLGELSSYLDSIEIAI